MKKQILSTVAAMAVLVAAGAAQAGAMTGTGGFNGISVNGWTNGMSLNGLNSMNGLESGNGIETGNALGTNGLSSSNGVSTEVPASGARVIFIELPAAR